MQQVHVNVGKCLTVTRLENQIRFPKLGSFVVPYTTNELPGSQCTCRGTQREILRKKPKNNNKA